MANIDVQVTIADDYSADEIFQMLERLNSHLRRDDIHIEHVSADWTDEETGDINYFMP